MILRTIRFHLSVDNPHKYMFERTTRLTPQNYSFDIHVPHYADDPQVVPEVIII